MSLARKYTIWSVVFYATGLALIPVFDKYSRGGPCAPGFGFFFMGLVGFLAVGGFVVSLVFRLRGKKVFTGPLVVSVGVLVLMYIMIRCNWI